MPRLALALSMVLVTAPALAWNEPDSFRGVPWGATQDEAEKTLREREVPVYCLKTIVSRTPSGGEITMCNHERNIGTVEARTSFAFIDDRFSQVFIKFKPNEYATLRRIFIERYGQPTSETEEPFQTKGGLKTTNQVARWTGTKVVILMRAYGRTINEGDASIMLAEDLKKDISEREKAIKKGAGGL